MSKWTPSTGGCGSVLTSCFTFPVGTHCNDFFFHWSKQQHKHIFFYELAYIQTRQIFLLRVGVFGQGKHVEDIGHSTENAKNSSPIFQPNRVGPTRTSVPQPSRSAALTSKIPTTPAIEVAKRTISLIPIRVWSTARNGMFALLSLRSSGLALRHGTAQPARRSERCSTGPANKVLVVAPSFNAGYKLNKRCQGARQGRPSKPM